MQITVSGQSYSYDATAGDIAGLGIARARVMDQLPPGEGQDGDTPVAERPGYVADDVEYLKGIIQRHCDATDEDPQAVMERCLRSWSTDEPLPPEELPQEPLSDEARRAALVAYAANKRWQKEIGGCAWGEHIVQTDRDSQPKIIAEFVAVQAGLRADPSPWKFASGFALVSNADMGAIALAVRNHIAQCFAIEAAVAADIATDTITDTAAIDAAFT